MVSRLRDKLGPAGLIVAIVALVAALAGGAYAASGLNGKQKKEVSKIAKKESKKFSKQFSKQFATPGPEGPTGPTGATGATGATGSPGAKGDDGAPGDPGKSVTVTEVEPGEPECAGLGGIEVEVEGSGEPEEVCNGEEGPQGTQGDPGDPGSPWVVGTAPSGAVLKGTWTVPPFTATAENEALYTPISMGVPIPSTAILAAFSGVPGETAFDSACGGTVENPTPTQAGFLCLYEGANTNLKHISNTAAARKVKGTAGVVMRFQTAAAGLAEGYGTWALQIP